MLNELLTSAVNASNYAKCVSLNNPQCMIQPTLVNLDPKGLCYYPFAFNMP